MHETFAGAHPGELLQVSADGVALLADGEPRWHAPHTDIRAVLAVRRVSDGVVHDAVHVCTTDGHDRHFLVATSLVSNDYDAEFSEAAADAIADRLRRAAGLDGVG